MSLICCLGDFCTLRCCVPASYSCLLGGRCHRWIRGRKSSPRALAAHRSNHFAPFCASCERRYVPDLLSRGFVHLAFLCSCILYLLAGGRCHRWIRGRRPLLGHPPRIGQNHFAPFYASCDQRYVSPWLFSGTCAPSVARRACSSLGCDGTVHERPFRDTRRVSGQWFGECFFGVAHRYTSPIFFSAACHVQEAAAAAAGRAVYLPTVITSAWWSLSANPVLMPFLLVMFCHSSLRPPCCVCRSMALV